MPFGFLQHRATGAFLSVCGQQIRVKNTFFDDVVLEKNDEDKQTSESLGVRAAQTCPDALLHTSCSEASQPEAEEQQDDLICDETLATLQWTAHTHMQTLSPLTTPTCMHTLSSADQEQRLSAARTLVVGPSEGKNSSIHMDAVEKLQEADVTLADKMLSVLQWPVLSTMPLCFPQGDTACLHRLQQVRRDDERYPKRPARVPPSPAMPAPAPAPPTRPPQLCFLEGNEMAPQQAFNSVVEQVESMPHGAQDSESDSEAKLVKLSSPEQRICRRAKVGRRHVRPKVWCYFFIDPVMCRHDFRLSRKVIGHGGNNTRNIFEQTAAKIRLRGRGSGHLEANGREAPVHLMLAVTSDIGQEMSFLTALQMSADLLEQVTSKYKAFCKHSDIPLPVTPLFWIGEVSDKAGDYMGLSAAETTVMLGDRQVPLLLDAPAKSRNSRPRQW
eukprot:TRINITY_DN3638_c0_g1_i1.p1 TRINITY_DN3638_c0_g1~~TRINITY_DN3638_c0_g1_i1.p1  ORF type:complete len:443 (-),score=82.92 TRINITY_DN3638_c0_g1_i1:312-1640(-)